jgi:hypothetical protein
MDDNTLECNKSDNRNAYYAPLMLQTQCQEKAPTDWRTLANGGNNRLSKMRTLR